MKDTFVYLESSAENRRSHGATVTVSFIVCLIQPATFGSTVALRRCRVVFMDKWTGFDAMKPMDYVVRIALWMWDPYARHGSDHIEEPGECTLLIRTG